jgi:hypothetical protein
MPDLNPPQAKPKAEPETKRKTDPDRDRAPDPTPDDSIEGEGSPGLTIGGGGGHA